MKHSWNILGIDRPVVALDDEYPAGFVDPMHAHDHVQILFASAGVMSVTTPGTSLVISPQRAVLLPALLEHEVSCRGSVSLRTLYLKPGVGPHHDRPRVFEVSRLLGALILEVIGFDPLYDVAGREGDIVRLLLAEIERMPTAPWHLHMPRDRRLLRVCREILADPADPRDIDDWARLASMGRRTFTRAFRAETGMGLATWRQQVRLMEALSRLSLGEPITRVAFEVGYDSPGGFSTMFRRAFGVPPSHYLAQ